MVLYIYMHKYMCTLRMQSFSESQSHPYGHQKCKSTLMMIQSNISLHCFNL